MFTYEMEVGSSHSTVTESSVSGTNVPEETVPVLGTS